MLTNMKHPSSNKECFEFNLGKAPNLRCLETDGTTSCTACENCQVRNLVLSTKQWFPKAGEPVRRKLLFHLIHHSLSQDLLEYVDNLLKPLSSKDYVYTRSRSNPGLEGDSNDAGHNRALNSSDIEADMMKICNWYQGSTYWSKINFLLALLQMCHGELLHSVGMLTRNILKAKESGFHAHPYDGDDYEVESLADTVHSFNSYGRSEFDLLREAAPEYSVPVNPFKNEDPSHIIIEPEWDEEGDLQSESSSVDPRLCFTPVSQRAMSSVMKYRDFIRDLPVHLSKYILSFMDYVQLVECMKVSPHWERIAREVEEDARLRQLLWEEVMLMQGSSAQGGNPVYASYLPTLVPQLAGEEYEMFYSDEPTQDVYFKSDINMNTSYTGLETKEVNMEARNIYCGPYNVMVLSDQEDVNRVVHYNYGELVPVGSFDRHVRFVDINSGHETGPLITGHAGSIKCLYINEKDGYVLSGSFDTSIRRWNIKSGKPEKIFHGHQGTITCMDMDGDHLVSGGKDNQVKVWNFLTGKCIRTYKHAKQIKTVAINGDLVASGCDGGRVKLWSISNKCLIKVLYKSPRQQNQFGLADPHTHSGPITCVKVDQYHIASGSTDGYALIWSSVGNLTKCVRALRHPMEVLCLEMKYMRLVTGCEDGKLRIWNMLSGDCLRVMRGNSRSDPIVSIHPCGDRLVLNTVNNLLVLNFEEIKWDYKQSEKIELMRYKNNFKDAPLRHHNYSYVRANRSLRASSANPKLVTHRTVSSINSSGSAHVIPGQMSHSTRSLSPQRLEKAKDTQRFVKNVTVTKSLKGSVYQNVVVPSESYKPKQKPDRPPVSDHVLKIKKKISRVGTPEGLLSSGAVHSTPTSRNSSRLSNKMPSSASARSNMSFSDKYSRSDSGIQSALSGLQSMSILEERFLNSRPSTAKTVHSSPSCGRKHLKQRIHSAPSLRRTSNKLTLSEARSLQNSQIRMNKLDILRDGLLLTVNNIELSKKYDSEVSQNTTTNTLFVDHVNPYSHSYRTPVKEDISSGEDSIVDLDSDEEFFDEYRTIVTSEKLVTPICTRSLNIRPHQSIHDESIKSTIPRSKLVRPQTAHSRIKEQTEASGRAQNRRCMSAVPTIGGRASSSRSALSRKKKYRGHTSSHPSSFVAPPPMLMQGRGYIEPGLVNAQSSERREGFSEGGWVPEEIKDPFTSHGEFQLRSRQQTQDYLEHVSRIQQVHEQKKVAEEKRRQKKIWRAKATGQTHKDFSAAPKLVAPEIGE